MARARPQAVGWVPSNRAEDQVARKFGPDIQMLYVQHPNVNRVIAAKPVLALAILVSVKQSRSLPSFPPRGQQEEQARGERGFVPATPNTAFCACRCSS